MDITGVPFLIVGSGFFGAVIAERIANDLGEEVLIIEKRKHIGGNCYSQIEPRSGIEYHRYGTHIFHTSNSTVWEYVNRFTEFNSYRHQVLSTYKDKVYQMPINLETINSFYGVNLKPFEVLDFLKEEIDKEDLPETPDNFEDLAISQMGRPLYEAFFRGYTLKQWNRDPKDMPASVLKRLPFRTNYEESYYYSQWQGIPRLGYTYLFKEMLRNPRIKVKLNLDFFDIKDQLSPETFVIYSGPIDQYFDYKFGKLDWRTLHFEHEIVAVEDYQGTAVMNYAESHVPYTRIHEPRHLHPERSYRSDKTLIIREYSKACTNDEPFYPINDSRNQALVKQYRKAATDEKNLMISGRLGDYKYYDMEATIARALELYEEKIKLVYGKNRISGLEQ